MVGIGYIRRKRIWLLITVLMIFHSTEILSEDIDLYQKKGPKNVMVVIDNSVNMSRPVYDGKLDYRLMMKGLIEQGLAEDENDCRNGSSWWDKDGSGNDYDRLDPNGIYLVSTWLSTNTVPGAQAGHRTRLMLSDVMENAGDEIDPAINRRCSLLLNPVIPAVNHQDRIWTLADPSTFNVDETRHVLFPSGIIADMDGKAVSVPNEMKGAVLPNGQTIYLEKQGAGFGTAAGKGDGFLQELQRFGCYFAGVFEISGKMSGFTADSNECESGGFDLRQVYFFATGNWLNFIKMVEDFRVTSSSRVVAGQDYYACGMDKAWRHVGRSFPEEQDRRWGIGRTDRDAVRIQTRMEVLQTVLQNLFQQTKGMVNWGVTICSGNNRGRVAAPLGTDHRELINQLQRITVDGTGCPIGETVQKAYNNNVLQFQADPSGLGCGNHFMLIISAGFPTDDTYNDDPAYWLKHEATYPHIVHSIGVGAYNPLLAEMADAGGGIYQTINNESDFRGVMTEFSRMIANAYTFSSPVVPIDQANMTQSGDAVYMVSFQPDDENPWAGNLKKYGLQPMIRGEGDCYRNQEELVIVDRDGQPAVDCYGTFRKTSTSCWSDAQDGVQVTAGGAGGHVVKSMQRVDFSKKRFYDFRNIYTCKNPSVSKGMVRFFRDGDSLVEDTISPLDLGLDGGRNKENYLERDRIINFLYGYDYDASDSGGKAYDEEKDGAPVKVRDWILGDIIHSRPCVIDYRNENGQPLYRFIAVGANDGMLHVFVDAADSLSSSKLININGREYQPGDEIWAFIPGEFLPRLKELKDRGRHPYFADGFCALYRSKQRRNSGKGSPSGAAGKYDDKILVFGERRGGRCYWALDVSVPDPSKWFVRWRLKGGDEKEDFSPELGYSWSKPTFAEYQESSSRIREVVIFGGGYDPEEDRFPEAWFDGNFDGIFSPGDPQDFFNIHNPQHDSLDNDRYDVYNPEQNEIGRGIFIVDLWDGSPIFQVTYGENSANGTFQKKEDMKWCFPADPTVISFPGVFVVYAADVYGQIWKVTYNRFDQENKWKVKRIFTANPGSDQTDAMDALSVEPSCNRSDFGRKLFHSPDVSYMGTDWSDDPVLYFVTGDRVHPRYIPSYANRLYVVSDTDAAADETDLINLTCDELDHHSDVNQDGSREYGDGPNNHDTLLRNRLLDILYGVSEYPESNQRCRGWYRILGKQGNCLGALQDHKGEMGLDRPVLFFNTVYFSTFQPRPVDMCLPGGNSFFYTIGYSEGRAVPGQDQTGTKTIIPENRTVEDTYQMIENNRIPSEIKLIIRPEGVSAFVCSGNSLVGLGAEQGTMIGNASNIPSPPGGVQRLMWKAH